MDTDQADRSTADDDAFWAQAESDTGLWIVQLDAPSAAAQLGQDVRTPAAADYKAQLQAEHTAFEAEMDAALGRSVHVEFTYLNVLNGLAVEVDKAEARQLSSLPGVAAVYPDDERELQTDVSHEVILSGAIWDGDNAAGLETRGEGLIVAMIDSGVNPEHPAFFAQDEAGYVHENPNGSGNYLGVCDEDHPSYDPTFECNDKLIGAYGLNPMNGSAWDDDGHGSHVGSTIAGNFHTANYAGIEREVQGVAPQANVISYQVCRPGCPSTASVAAVDLAIDDDVDVLNYSISGGDMPWNDSVDLAFLDAYNAGIVVSASAGNDGPGAGTVAKTGPWNLAVGMTTHNRVFGHGVTVTVGDTEVGPFPGFPGDGPQFTEVIDAPIVDSAELDNQLGCTPFEAGAFEDSVALIQRGDCTFAVKALNAEDAGATALVLYNNAAGPPTAAGGLADAGVAIPVLMVADTAGAEIRDALADGDGDVHIDTDLVLEENDDWTDIIAAGSSRGPTQYDMLAPTVAAPGVNILAAFNNGPDHYGVISGTSMSSPHAAGAAALLADVYPDLNPTEIRSIMALTAEHEGLRKEDGATPADSFDIGSGRINLEQAGRAGLVLDETGENFLEANPSTGGDPATLNLPAMVTHDSGGSYTWTRTVTSIADAEASYTVAAQEADGTTITVTPEEFTLAPGAEQELTIEVDTTGADLGTWTFGRITLETSGTHSNGLEIADSQLPVVAMPGEPTEEGPQITVDPAELEATQAANEVTTQTLTIGNTGEGDLTWEFVEETGGDGDVIHEQEIGGTSGIVSDFWTTEDAGVFSAENFEVSGSATITSLYTPGFWIGKDVAVEASAIDWEIFADDGGQPGDEPVWSFSSAPGEDGVTIVDNEITLDLNAAGADPAELGAGTYWLSVWPSIPMGPNLNDRWNWYQGTADGTDAMLIDPDNLFGLGATEWAPIVDLVGDFGDLAMTIEGEGGAGDACGADWLSVDPASGTTAPDGSSEVEVSFDSTGLDEGVYETVLCIESNDTDASPNLVPVTLEVGDDGDPVGPPAIEVDPAEVSNEQEADQSTEHTLTISNTGGEDLEFDITEHESGDAGQALALPVGADRAAGETVTGDPAPALVPPADVASVEELEEGFDNVDTLPGDGWAMENASEPVGVSGWFQGNPAVFEAHEGAPDAYIGANFNNAGGSPGNINNWLMTPELDLTEGSELTFFSRSSDVGPENWADRLEVRLSTSGDSTDVGGGFDEVGDFTELLLTINEDLDDTGYPSEWTEYTVTVEGVDADTTGRIAFRYHVPDGGPAGNNSDFIGIDTVSYQAGDAEPPVEACEDPSDVPWLSVDPATGTVEPGGSVDVTVTLDSTGLDLGDYTADLCIASNDPENPETFVPVTLTVVEEGEEPPGFEVERIGGADRYEVAANVAAAYPDGAETVYIASGQGYPDALTGGAAAAQGLTWQPANTPEGDPAPILLTNSNTDVPTHTTLAALTGIDPANVIVLGGTDSISENVETQLQAAVPDADFDRIDGADRYEVAAGLAGMFTNPDVVYVASGQDGKLADSLAAAATAATTASPVLLVKADHIPAVTAATLDELAPSQIILAGGEETVEPEIAEALGAWGEVTRVDGKDRYEVAANLAAGYEAADTVYLAAGDNDDKFADALTGGALAGSQGEPLLLTQFDHIPADSVAQLLRLEPSKVVLFGGIETISETVEDDLWELFTED